MALGFKKQNPWKVHQQQIKNELQISPSKEIAQLLQCPNLSGGEKGRAKEIVRLLPLLEVSNGKKGTLKKEEHKLVPLHPYTAVTELLSTAEAI